MHFICQISARDFSDLVDYARPTFAAELFVLCACPPVITCFFLPDRLTDRFRLIYYVASHASYTDRRTKPERTSLAVHATDTKSPVASATLVQRLSAVIILHLS